MPQKLIAGPVSKIGYQPIRSSITLDMIFNNRLKMEEFIKEKGEKLNLPQ